MNALLGRKIGMTQIFDNDGAVVPVTVVEAGPCTVVQRKSVGRDGYASVQLSFGVKKKPNKPLSGHHERAGTQVGKVLKEFRIGGDEEGLQPGDTLSVSIFHPGDVVKVTGRSKGRGFAGTGKRYGFAGGKATHGCKSHRKPGAMGCASTPSRTFKGRKLPGRMGNAKVTLGNVTVVRIDEDRNLIMLRGAVPGSRNGYVTIRNRDS